MRWFGGRGHYSVDDLSAYLDGELGGPATALEEHLQTCGDCSRALEDLRTARSLLAELPRVQARRSFAVNPVAARSPQLSARAGRFVYVPVAAFAVLVALLLADFVVVPAGDNGRGGPGGAAVTADKAASEAGGPATLALPSEARAPTAAAQDSSTQRSATTAAAPDAPQPQTGAAPPSVQAAAPAAPPPQPPPGVTPAQSQFEAPPAVATASTADGVTSSATAEPAGESVHRIGNDESGENRDWLRALEALAGAVLAGSLAVLGWRRLQSNERH